MIGFFEEQEDSRSIMRLCFFITVISMLALSFVIELRDNWNIYNSGLVGSVLGFASLFKAWQKKHEVKGEITETIAKNDLTL